MAKLGNEAKLVMKLAKERMRVLVDTKASDTAYRSGYVAGVADYTQELLNIANELERG